ncbi:MAG TPA: two-component sensor histidine kinase, partial [Rhodospirillales bacterium]
MGPVTSTIKRFLPKTLMGRSILIIVTPLVVLQLVSAVIFYQTHWDKVTLRLARGVAGDIAAVINLMRRHPGAENREWIYRVAADNMELLVTFEEAAVLPNIKRKASGLTEEMLSEAMDSFVSRPYQVDSQSRERDVIIDVQLSNGVL